MWQVWWQNFTFANDCAWLQVLLNSGPPIQNLQSQQSLAKVNCSLKVGHVADSVEEISPVVLCPEGGTARHSCQSALALPEVTSLA